MKKTGMNLFLLLVAGQFISSVGSGLTDFGLAIYALNSTGSVTATSIVSICAFLPCILFSPLGGALADRYDRRRMMLTGELLSAIGLFICLAALGGAFGGAQFFAICAGVAVSSLFSALTEPAFKATVSDLLSEEDYARASGLTQIASSAKLIVSPVVAGLLLRKTGVGTLIVIDILTFFTTAAVIAAVNSRIEKAEKQKRESVGLARSLKEGWAALGKSGGVRAMIVVMTIAVFCLGFIQILSKPVTLAFADEAKLGLLTTISAFGMLAGSVAVSGMKNIRSNVRLLSLGMMGCGFFMALMPARESIALMAAAGFMMFCFMPAVQVGAEVLIRKSIPNELQGRAFGMIGLITQSGYIIAYILSGVLSDNVFEPFMSGESGASLAVGAVIGNGAGRGAALLIMTAGLLLVLTGLAVGKMKCVKEMEKL